MNPSFRFLRNSAMPAESAPPIAEVRRQFDTAQLVQRAFYVLVGQPRESYDTTLNSELGIDLVSLRKLARGMGVAVSQPDWFAAILRG